MLDALPDPDSPRFIGRQVNLRDLGVDLVLRYKGGFVRTFDLTRTRNGEAVAALVYHVDPITFEGDGECFVVPFAELEVI